MEIIKLPRKLLIFTLAIIILGNVIFVNILLNYNLVIFNSFVIIILFVFLELISDYLAVELPKIGNVSVSFAIDIMVYIIFGAPIAIFIAFLSFLFQIRKVTESIDLYIFKKIVNASQSAIAIFIAYLLTNITSKLINIDLLNIFIFAFLYLLLNTLIIGLIVTLSLGGKLIDILYYLSVKEFLPNYLILTILGILMAFVFQKTGIPGLLLLFMPLLVARYVFKLYSELRKSYLATIKALIKALEAKDPYTKGHSERVAELAVEIAKEMGLNADQIDIIRHMALLHDVGKIGILDTVLNKKGTLDPEEKELIQEHPVLGAKIVEEIPFLKQYAGMVRHHHERFDGTGYPDKVSGEKIPLGARIIAVADTYDAMTSDRPYRAALTKEQAISELERNAGQQHDPKVVKALLKVLERFDPREKELEALKEAAAEGS